MTMKTKEELNALKNKIEDINKKLADLTEDELRMVTGGDSTITLHNLPVGPNDDKYKMPLKAGHDELDTRKDLYENIIL